PGGPALAAGLPEAPAGGPGADPPGDAVEPPGERPAGADGAGVPDQREEGGLEGVLGVGAAAEDPAARTEDHRPVPPDDRLEGEGVAVGGEPAEEFAVGQVGQPVAGGEPAEVVDEFGQGASHAGPPFRRCSTGIEPAGPAERPEKMPAGASHHGLQPAAARLAVRLGHVHQHDPAAERVADHLHPPRVLAATVPAAVVLLLREPPDRLAAELLERPADVP